MESEKDFKLVGREKEKEEIIDQLILLRRGGNEANPPVPVIIIAGLAGVGKTKLASQVFKDENVKQNVGLPARVSGTNCNSFDAVSIARRVIGATASSPNRIVFLDDWRVEIGDQDVNALQHELKEAAGLCVTAIVITTRSCLVAMARKIAASPVKSYTLPGLNEEESLTLFQTILGRGPVDNSSITEDVRRKFVGQCGGVPRAIIIMAELLCSPGSRLTELTGQFLNKLKNYYDVEFPDKLCFDYCSLFPQDYLFDAERLIRLWMAEEFLNHSNPSTSSGSEPDPEETGRGYLKELVGRSIFQVVEEDEFGKVRSCRMHPLMHDIARFVADKEKKNITVDPNGDKVHQQVQRASFDLSLLDFRRGIPAPLFDKAKQLRSILFFRKTQLRRLLLQLDMSETVLKKIFKSFKRLSVLDLRDLEIVEVPSSIGELEDLKYLDLSQNNMKKLPSSIAKLSKLETLKLSRCKYLKELPKNFESLPQLKHLDMEGCLGLTCMPRKISKLTSLQTLSAFVASKSDPMGGLEELAKLNKLSGNLEILYLDRVQSLENRETKYLEEKQQLQRLTLRWDDFEVDEEKGKGHLALLDRLKPHSDLGVLILVGYQGPSLSTWLTSSSIEFKCLVKLRLLKCPGCKYLSQQDQLPKLKILELVRLDNLEYVAQNCDKEAVFYTTLKELTITDCPNLKSWWQTEEDVNDRPFFASISKLHVQRCPLLTCMPLYPRLHMILEGSSRFGKEMVLEGSSSLKLLLDTRSMSVNYSIPLENLHIQNCIHLENLSNGFQHLRSLQRLTIEDCAEINLDGPSNKWEGLKSLRFLTIKDIPNLRSLSFGDSLTTLRALSIRNCHKLTSISESIRKVTSLRELTLNNCHRLTSISESIGNVTSLRKMEISDCNKLQSLPIAMKDLVSLKTLLISDCALLLPRCQLETGDDWPQIRHIKHFNVK